MTSVSSVSPRFTGHLQRSFRASASAFHVSLSLRSETLKRNTLRNPMPAGLLVEE
jgi:hypothetical protein